MSRLQQALERVADEDVRVLLEKDKEYGSSWKRRGGIGAFMMLARKIDRIEEQVKRHGYDIFAAVVADMRAEGLRDDIADLRRYLMLVETEIVPSPHADMTGEDRPRGFDPAEDM